MAHKECSGVTIFVGKTPSKRHQAHFKIPEMPLTGDLKQNATIQYIRLKIESLATRSYQKESGLQN